MSCCWKFSNLKNLTMGKKLLSRCQFRWVDRSTANKQYFKDWLSVFHHLKGKSGNIEYVARLLIYERRNYRICIELKI